MDDKNAAVREEAILLGRARSRIALLSHPVPEADGSAPGAVLFLNAGVLHRIGPNRIYVRLSRSLARRGWLGLRFDFSGIGDSPGRDDESGFDDYTIEETVEAMNLLEDSHAAREFVLVGICSGADIAYRVARRDERVRALVLINPMVLDANEAEQVLSRAADRTKLRYYVRRTLDPRSLLRFVSFRSDYRTIVSIARRKLARMLRRPTPVPPERETDCLAELESLLARDVRMCLIFSEGSTAFDVFELVLAPTSARFASQYPALSVSTMVDTDHVFTLVSAQDDLEARIANWLASGTPAATRAIR